MEHYKRMAIFAEVVACGSLSGAARQLGMTPSAVSQHLRHSVTISGRKPGMKCKLSFASPAFVDAGSGFMQLPANL